MKRILVILMFFSTMAPAIAYSQDVFEAPQVIPSLRADIGKPLLDVSLGLINQTQFNPEKITPQGASFFFSTNAKEVGQNVDELRGSHYFVIAMTTCPNATSLDAKIDGITIWEDVRTENERQLIAVGVQQMLELMNDPPAVQTPSVMRAPQPTGLHGVVFSYTKGDTREQFSLLNEDNASQPLKIQWSVSNNAICPSK